MTRRLFASPDSRRVAVPLALVALSLLYLVTVLPNLGNDPIVGGDEGWIMSASAKLAQHGVFGSDMFRGFYDADQHYYFNLPLHHVLLAGAFKLLGVGVAQARLVSVAFGLAALLLTYALGRRLGGELVGLGAAALLVLLRLNLAPFSGLTLTDLGATVRYDLIAVPYGLAAMLLLLRRPDSPSAGIVAAAGLLVGLAGLTQFIGAFFALPLALFLLSLALPIRRRIFLVGLFSLAIALPLMPYGVYLATDWSDFRGQARALDQQTSFASPAFYVRQLRDEPHRYAMALGLSRFPDSPRELARRPSARLALLFVTPLAALRLVLRGRRSLPHRLLGFTMIGLMAQLALFESTKRIEYWVVVVPALCVAAADLALEVWRWRPYEPSLRWPARAAVLAALTLFAAEGLAVAAKDVRDSGRRSSYAALSRHLEHVLPPDASAMGDNRLWPALRDRDYRSLLLLFYDTNPDITGSDATDVFGAMQRINPDYLLLSPLSRQILTQLIPRDAADFQRFLDTRTEEVASVPDADYGPIDVYKLKK